MVRRVRKIERQFELMQCKHSPVFLSMHQLSTQETGVSLIGKPVLLLFKIFPRNLASDSVGSSPCYAVPVANAILYNGLIDRKKSCKKRTTTIRWIQ